MAFIARARASACLAAIVIAVGLLAAACSSTTSTSASGNDQTKGTEPEPPPRQGGRLVFGLSGENDGFLPQANRFGPSAIQIARTVFDPLVVIGQDNYMHAYLADSIQPTNPEFSQWLIKTRPTTFHNGEKFDADALLLNLQTFQESALTSSAMKPIINFEKVDDTTVQVNMNQSWANFPSLFTTQVGYVAAPSQINNKEYNKPVGTGPFKFASWTPGGSFKATRNDNYWQKGLPYLDQVEFRPIQDVDARRKALEAKDIDVAHTNGVDDLVRSVKENDPPRDTKVIVDEGEGDEYVAVLNTQTGPFVDKNLRIALAKATDKKSLIDLYSDDFYLPADGPYNDGSQWRVPSGQPEFDLPGAKKLIEEWKNKNGGAAPKFVYATVSTSDDAKVAQILQEQWKAAGFDVVLEAQDEAKFSSTIVFGKFEAMGFKFFNSPDPDSDYYFWTNDGVGPPEGISLNFPRYKSDVVQEGLIQGRASSDIKKRQEGYAKVWKDWGENVPYIFMFHTKWALIYNVKVHNLGVAKAPDGAPIPKLMWGTTFLTNTWIEP